jgi:hypothetical protein
MKRFELGRVVMTPNVARTPGASMVTTRQHTGPAVEEPPVRPSGKRGSLSSAMRWRAALAVCALFAPATSCATSRPCVALVPSRLVTLRPPRLPTTGDPYDPFNVCVTTPDAPECFDHSAPGASPRCDGRPGCGPDPTPRFDRCYREGGERKPLRVSTSRYFPGPGGSCQHDGECRLGGCKDRCVSYRRPPAYFTCTDNKVLRDPPPPNLPDRTDLVCGCVEGQCTFFSQ